MLLLSQNNVKELGCGVHKKKTTTKKTEILVVTNTNA